MEIEFPTAGGGNISTMELSVIARQERSNVPMRIWTNAVEKTSKREALQLRPAATGWEVSDSAELSSDECS